MKCRKAKIESEITIEKFLEFSIGLARFLHTHTHTHSRARQYTKIIETGVHLGNSNDFGEKLQEVIDSCGTLGARLIYYPLSCLILDFYHVMELALRAFAPSSLRASCSILESEVETVIEDMRLTSVKEENKRKLILYYENNKKRMRYKQYRNMGCGIIGSRAIESAHRTLIQKRMKLSGQLCSRNGTENMLRLRGIILE
jgi:hypothetical protein